MFSQLRHSEVSESKNPYIVEENTDLSWNILKWFGSKHSKNNTQADSKQLKKVDSKQLKDDLQKAEKHLQRLEEQLTGEKSSLENLDRSMDKEKFISFQESYKKRILETTGMIKRTQKKIKQLKKEIK